LLPISKDFLELTKVGYKYPACEWLVHNMALLLLFDLSLTSFDFERLFGFSFIYLLALGWN